MTLVNPFSYVLRVLYICRYGDTHAPPFILCPHFCISILKYEFPYHLIVIFVPPVPNIVLTQIPRAEYGILLLPCFKSTLEDICYDTFIPKYK